MSLVSVTRVKKALELWPFILLAKSIPREKFVQPIPVLKKTTFRHSQCFLWMQMATSWSMAQTTNSRISLITMERLVFLPLGRTMMSTLTPSFSMKWRIMCWEMWSCMCSPTLSKNSTTSSTMAPSPLRLRSKRKCTTRSKPIRQTNCSNLSWWLVFPMSSVGMEILTKKYK